MILKNFIVFEGCDGAGTTTQRAFLCKKLQDEFDAGRGSPVFDTFEPTDGAIGRLVRSCLSGELTVSGSTMAFLFAADRNEHVFGENGISEHVARGDITVCDRYLLSSLVYQGILCGDELPARLNQSFPMPEFLFFLDIEPELAFKRIASRGEKREIYEYVDFQVQVRERYHRLLPWCAGQGSMVKIIDAAAPVETIADEIWNTLRQKPSAEVFR